MRIRRPRCFSINGRIKLFYGFVLFLFVFLLIWFEETHFGHLDNFYGNLHTQIIFRPINLRRGDVPHPPGIWVFVVVDSAEQLAEYGLAQHTLRCYCALQAYPLRVIDLSKEGGRECPQSDFMFRRHCALAHFLGAHPDIEFAVFLDADMGVINPDHALEEFMAPIVADGQVDMIFYERTFNGEIMAGSYLLRNSNFSRQLLHFWAMYHFRLPRINPSSPWHYGTDNAAIHAIFLDLFCAPNCADQVQICHQLWNASTDFSSLQPFTACARNVLGSRNIFHSILSNTIEVQSAGKVLVLTDFRKFWARDGWLTANCWSPRDFIFHGWQNRRLNRPVFARWHSPLAFPMMEPPNWTISCLDKEIASQNWPYKDTFMRNEEEIDAKMEKIVKQRRERSLELLKDIL